MLAKSHKDRTEANEQYNIAVEILEKNKHESLVAVVLCDLGLRQLDYVVAEKSFRILEIIRHKFSTQTEDLAAKREPGPFLDTIWKRLIGDGKHEKVVELVMYVFDLHVEVISEDDVDAGRLRYMVGQSYVDVRKKMEQYHMALKIFQKQKDEGWEAVARAEIGTLQLDTGDYEGAEKSFPIAAEIIKRKFPTIRKT